MLSTCIFDILVFDSSATSVGITVFEQYFEYTMIKTKVTDKADDTTHQQYTTQGNQSYFVWK